MNCLQQSLLVLPGRWFSGCGGSWLSPTVLLLRSGRAVVRVEFESGVLYPNQPRLNLVLFQTNL